MSKREDIIESIVGLLNAPSKPANVPAADRRRRHRGTESGIGVFWTKETRASGERTTTVIVQCRMDLEDNSTSADRDVDALLAWAVSAVKADTLGDLVMDIEEVGTTFLVGVDPVAAEIEFRVRWR